MDALQGYGSSSDSEADQSHGLDNALPLQSTQRAQGALPQPAHDAQAPKPVSSDLKLPSANDLFGSPSQAVRHAIVTLCLTDELVPAVSSRLHQLTACAQHHHHRLAGTGIGCFASQDDADGAACDRRCGAEAAAAWGSARWAAAAAKGAAARSRCSAQARRQWRTCASAAARQVPIRGTVVIVQHDML
jgi:hypothetical protein